MDKNTITGLVLIAILLVGFSFLSRPSQEQLEAQQRYYDSIAQVQQREADLKAKAEAALANESGAEASVDSTALFFDARQGTNSQVTIQNNLAEITVDTKGGRIASATLKEYMGQDKTTPVTLFSGNDASMNFLFYPDGRLLFHRSKPYGQYRHHAFVGRQQQLYRLYISHAQ